MRFLYFFISSSLLIGLVLLIRKVFRKKLSPKVIYALWIIPLIRLMIPFAIWEMPVYGMTADILNAPQELILEWMGNENIADDFVSNAEAEPVKLQIQEHAEAEDTKVPDEALVKTDEQINEQTNLSDSQRENAVIGNIKSYDWIWYGIWFMGSAVLGGITLYRNRKLGKCISLLKPVDNAEDIPVCICKEVSVPCLVGVIRPRILVTREVMENPELYKYVLWHEKAHYCQKDHIWTAIRILMCIIYWWNPVIWIASVCVNEDAELACDAKAVKDQAVEERRNYGHALLQLLENAKENNYSLYAATSISGNKKSMKRRIEEIVNATNTRKQVSIPVMAGLIAILILGCAVPMQTNWIESSEWESGDDGEAIFSEAEYSYGLQDDIKSSLIYYEIYEYGELVERRILGYGDIKEHTGTMKLRTESSKYTDDHGLSVEFNGIRSELKNPASDYDISGGHVSGALYEESKIEIEAEDDLIMMSNYGAKDGEQIVTLSCMQLSSYTEEQLRETLKDKYVAAFIRFVVSQKDQQELYDTYSQKEVYADNSNTYSEDQSVLTFDIFLEAVRNNSIEKTDWKQFSNGNRDDLSENALNYYVSYNLEYEGQKFRLDFSYSKEEETPPTVYITKEDYSMIWVYDADEQLLRFSEEEIVDFIKTDQNIMNEIAFELPKDLSLDDYNANIGFEGGCLFLPMVYEGEDSYTPSSWMASGMVSRYTQSVLLEWNGDTIENLYLYYNHTSTEIIEQVDGLCAPALLAHFNHDLYTAADMGEMEAEGIDLNSIELTSDYWYLFIAQPEEEYGYVITLNQKNYTKEDILNLGKTIQILDN